ncbi:hypothetical protein N7462_003076 [Penicillium macrosclerotiorum]|uniref:uncharacterized protein n=1 Tax=Penicillium macrosclerotiorum TaxID=303699 RepID=UPI002549AC01|nr:uncharacterized protein N7462_003076 [Penicillium macrosclerotiorum]KAJ5688684.1 hypothetical protein N7462_003076 [Penicillium macrosclerotiorum]
MLPVSAPSYYTTNASHVSTRLLNLRRRSRPPPSSLSNPPIPNDAINDRRPLLIEYRGLAQHPTYALASLSSLPLSLHAPQLNPPLFTITLRAKANLLCDMCKPLLTPSRLVLLISLSWPDLRGTFDVSVLFGAVLNSQFPSFPLPFY